MLSPAEETNTNHQIDHGGENVLWEEPGGTSRTKDIWK